VQVALASAFHVSAEYVRYDAHVGGRQQSSTTHRSTPAGFSSNPTKPRAFFPPEEKAQLAPWFTQTKKRLVVFRKEEKKSA